MLISKINAQMILKCEKVIKKEQIAELAKYRTKAERINVNEGTGIRDLVHVELSQFDITEESASGYTV